MSHTQAEALPAKVRDDAGPGSDHLLFGRMVDLERMASL
jgi:hypothetical protein